LQSQKLMSTETRWC